MPRAALGFPEKPRFFKWFSEKPFSGNFRKIPEIPKKRIFRNFSEKSVFLEKNRFSGKTVFREVFLEKLKGGNSPRTPLFMLCDACAGCAAPTVLTLRPQCCSDPGAVHAECTCDMLVAPYLLTVLHSVWLGATAVRY